MSVTHIKSENISCRISTEHKQMIERAARLSGFSMSDFIIHALVNAASETLSDESIIRLSADEWDRFTSSLKQPGRTPSEATKKAVEIFRNSQDEYDKQT